MINKNPDLLAVQKQLIALVDELSRRQEEAQSTDAVKAIGREIVEVNHRLTMVGQLVFKEETAKISKAVEEVRQRKKAVDDAIQSIEKLNVFITTITKFLALVDKAIDTAKLVA